MKNQRRQEPRKNIRKDRSPKSKFPSSRPRFSGTQRDVAPVKPNNSEKWVDIPKNWRTVVGTHAIREAVSVHAKYIEQVWIKTGWESSQELKELHKDFKARNLKVEEKSAAILDKIMASHQGAAVFLSKTPEADWEQISQKPNSVCLVLDGIEDPHNLGAILRTSWLMGVDAVITPEDRSVGLTSTAHKVACGGAEHVPVERLTNFTNQLESLKKDGYWVFGLSHEGERSLLDLKIPEKVVWCIGSEDKGLRTTTERLCDELIRIPQVSAAASYNASVATAIALTETFRQQSVKKD
jgi:23S rRNA (guanosine2251-2'-O)-methyltransferase